MTRKREARPRPDRTPEVTARASGSDVALDTLLESFSQSEVESGIVSAGRGREGAGLTADGVVDRLADALVEVSVARLLRTARDRAGLTLAELAERLHISRGRVHQLERDGANLEIGTVGRVASALGYEARIAFVPRDASAGSALIAPVPTIDGDR